MKTNKTYSSEERLSAQIFGITPAAAREQFQHLEAITEKPFVPNPAIAAEADKRFRAAFPNANR